MRFGNFLAVIAPPNSLGFRLTQTSVFHRLLPASQCNRISESLLDSLGTQQLGIPRIIPPSPFMLLGPPPHLLGLSSKVRDLVRRHKRPWHTAKAEHEER